MRRIQSFDASVGMSLQIALNQTILPNYPPCTIIYYIALEALCYLFASSNTHYALRKDKYLLTDQPR